MQLKIHHVAIICANYQRSKHFYTEILGLTIIAETYRADRQSYKLDLALHDGCQIELFSFPGAPLRASYPESQGLRHLAFSVPDIQKIIDVLAAHNIACEPIRKDELTGKHFTFFQDPDDLPLELYEQ